MYENVIKPVDIINETYEYSIGVPIFTFTISTDESGSNAQTFSAERDMTWGEWINSSYNTLRGSTIGSIGPIEDIYILDTDNSVRIKLSSQQTGYLVGNGISVLFRDGLIYHDFGTTINYYLYF